MYNNSQEKEEEEEEEEWYKGRMGLNSRHIFGCKTFWLGGNTEHELKV